MRKIIILKVPENVQLDSLAEEVQEAIASVFAKWTNETMPGTTHVAGYKLLMARITGESLQVASLIAGFGLDWQDYGMRSCKKQPKLDADGEPVMVTVDEGLETEHQKQVYEHIFDTPFSLDILTYLPAGATVPVQLARGVNDDEIWLK